MLFLSVDDHASQLTRAVLTRDRNKELFDYAGFTIERAPVDLSKSSAAGIKAVVRILRVDLVSRGIG